MTKEREGDSAVQRQNPNRHGSKRARFHPRRALLVATWNVRTLVESVGGDRRICRSRPQHTTVDCAQVASPHLVAHKLDLLVKELRRYRVWVAGIFNAGNQVVWEGHVASRWLYVSSFWSPIIIMWGRASRRGWTCVGWENNIILEGGWGGLECC